MKSKKKILIVSHDAGGANLLAAWLSHEAKASCEYQYILAGPAVEIFSSLLPGLINKSCLDLEALIDKSDTILMTTSWASNLEKIAFLKAKQKNKHVIVALDHWAYYKERLFYNGNYLLPDEFWVFDDYAKLAVSEAFPGSRISQYKNYYLSIFSSQYKAGNESKGLLFMSQPIKLAISMSKIKRHMNYNEYEAFDYLVEIIKNKGVQSIGICLHPAENKEKIDEYKLIANNRIDTEFPEKKYLIDLYQDYSQIVGCFSYALVVALHLKKEVYHCIPRLPSLSRDFMLPHKEIISIEHYNSIEIAL